MEIHLHAFRLSQSAHLELTSYRRGLYREHDCISAVALPVLIPLGWSIPGSSTEHPYITPPEGILTTGERPETENGSWFLPIDRKDYIREIQDSLGSSASGLFTLSEGIYLGREDELPETLPAIKPLRISDLWLTTLRITVKDPSVWQHDIFISSDKEIHIR